MTPYSANSAATNAATNSSRDDSQQASPGPTQTLWAEHALTVDGWAKSVAVKIGRTGRITSIDANVPAKTGDKRVAILLPAPANLHSHAFQRALAGLTEHRSRNSNGARDNFWSWRQLMYRFLVHLDPSDIESISAYVYMQMLRCGYASVGEFHYLHHQPDGSPYTEIAELSHRVCAAAQQAGIGLTLLPVLYQRGGCDDRALNESQRRFGNDPDRYQKLWARADNAIRTLSPDARIGVAPHSLRAVSAESLALASKIAPAAPMHIHIAEQTAEIEELVAATGQRPVQWLLEHCQPDQRWCLVHATHMTNSETTELARTGAIVGLCPITEANLGDGIFEGSAYLGAGGRFGVGSDSNIRISLSEELRLLEYSQRLKERTRAVMASDSQSTGRFLFESISRGGAQAIGREAGTLSVGKWADLITLDGQHPELEHARSDQILDSFIFAADDDAIRDVWSGGRHVVIDGQHFQQESITRQFRQTMAALREKL